MKKLFGRDILNQIDNKIKSIIGCFSTTCKQTFKPESQNFLDPGLAKP